MLYLRLLFVAGLLGMAGAAAAQGQLSAVPSQQIEMSPEVAPYNSKIEAFYKTLQGLAEKPEDLKKSQLTTLHQLRQDLGRMQENLKKEVSERPYLDALVRPVSDMAKVLDQADKQLEHDDNAAATQSVKQAEQIATGLVQEPIVKLIVAEQKTNAAVKLMEEKRYQDAVLVCDHVISLIAGLRVPAGAPYADELETLKSHVLSLRRHASQKASSSQVTKLAKVIEKSFDTTHESVYGGVWTGPMDMQKLR